MLHHVVSAYFSAVLRTGACVWGAQQLNSDKRQENDNLRSDLHFQCIVLVWRIGAFSLCVCCLISMLFCSFGNTKGRWKKHPGLRWKLKGKPRISSCICSNKNWTWRNVPYPFLVVELKFQGLDFPLKSPCQFKKSDWNFTWEDDFEYWITYWVILFHTCMWCGSERLVVDFVFNESEAGVFLFSMRVTL